MTNPMPLTLRPLTGWRAFAAWCSKSRGRGRACCLTWWAGAGWRGTQLRGCPPRRLNSSVLADCSSLTPLRRVPRQPVPLECVPAQPLQSIKAQSRGGWGGWRSEVKEERSGGHSRSHPPRPLRRAPTPKRKAWLWSALGHGPGSIGFRQPQPQLCREFRNAQ